jgi:quercetin dioxygenase-like cupin family protein
MSGSTLQLQGDEGEVHRLLGVAHRILVGSEETNGAAAVVEITVPPGTGSPPHIDRREALVWYVVEGAIDFETEAGPVKLEAGGVIVLERDSRHGFTNRGDHPARGLLVAVPAGIEGFFSEAASVLPAKAPAGPPPADVANALAEVAGRYGIELMPKEADGVAIAAHASDQQ